LSSYTDAFELKYPNSRQQRLIRGLEAAVFAGVGVALTHRPCQRKARCDGLTGRGLVQAVRVIGDVAGENLPKLRSVLIDLLWEADPANPMSGLTPKGQQMFEGVDDASGRGAWMTSNNVEKMSLAKLVRLALLARPSRERCQEVVDAFPKAAQSPVTWTLYQLLVRVCDRARPIGGGGEQARLELDIPGHGVVKV